jgi:hypothetical protein
MKHMFPILSIFLLSMNVAKADRLECVTVSGDPGQGRWVHRQKQPLL